ncbi:MAG: YvcK family protein [Bacilli bacterium]|nr:YvcK family protein [Bacilli bacterium]
MNKKIVVLGGGTGMSTLLRGLKQYPIDITAIVSVCDDGRSTGRLREEFNTPAVGDIRQVLVALSETEPLFQQLLNYRFDTTSDLNGHALGNLLLTAMQEVAGNMSDGIESIGKVLNLKGKVLPLTEENVTLVGRMADGSIIEGEHHITESVHSIKEVYYMKEPKVCPKALKAVKDADLIILSMGSLFTSIIPNLICAEMIEALAKTKAKIMYVCNMMTQPGETDEFKASDHVKLLNQYLKKRRVDVLIANNGEIEEDLCRKYETMEQKDPVLFDEQELEKLELEIIAQDFTSIDGEYLRHNVNRLAFHIFAYLMNV